MRSKFKWIFTLLLAFTMQFSFAQEKTVTGTVSDGKVSLPMANVTIKGTKNGVQTDMDGKFSIKVKQGDVLVVSYQGYDSKEVKVGASNNYGVVLKEEAKILDEVLITQGYRLVTKKKAIAATASVSSKTIENRPNANVMNSIQGQLAGVNVTASTGQPGAKSAVVIRGVGTLTGNSDPLYVIDGFPVSSDNFRSLNPNDVASMEVLKDASAITEYGSRGANGVIVIKTKKGSFGDAKTTFRYTSTIGMSELQTPRYNFANARQLLQIEKNFGNGLGSSLTDQEIAAYNVDTDWVNYFFNKGTMSQHNLNIENTSKNVNAFTSVGYLDQEGVLKTTGLKRFNVRNNVNGKSDNEKFKYMINSFFGYSKNNEATNLGTGAVNRNYVLGAYSSAPYISPSTYENPQQLFDLYQADGTLLYTPLFLIDKLNTYTNLTEEIRASVNTEYSYKLFKDLTVRGRTNGELLDTRFTQSEHPISFNALLFLGVGQEFGGFEDVNSRREFRFNQLWVLDYNKTFGKHTIGITANTEYNHAHLQTNNFRQRGLNPQTFVPGTGSGYLQDVGTNDFYVPVVSSGKLRLNRIGYFGSLDYDYDSRYGVSASIRSDYTSRFLNSSLAFYSIGGRWNIDEESFMKGVDFVKTLKLRGSVGTVGNERLVDGTEFAGLNPPGFFDVYAPLNNAYNGALGFSIGFGYPDLQWESTRMSNIGLDFELFKNKRLRGTVDLYEKKSDYLYFDNPVSPTSGTTSVRQNTSIFVKNRGVEVNLAYDLINNPEKGMLLTLRGNGSVNNQKVGNLLQPIIDGSAPQYITQNGGMIEEPYVYQYAGVNPATGNMWFVAADGTLTETPVEADKRATGKNYLPQIQGGFGFDFDYKGFFMSTLFTYAFKVWRFDFDEDGLYDPGNIGQFTVSSDMLNAWTPTNTNTDVPALNASNFSAAAQSDRFLRDASYVRLRNLQIGYRVPKKFIEKTFIKDLSIMAQGENLFNITPWNGIDPESNRNADQYQYPTPRIYTLTLDVKF